MHMQNMKNGQDFLCGYSSFKIHIQMQVKHITLTVWPQG